MQAELEQLLARRGAPPGAPPRAAESVEREQAMATVERARMPRFASSATGRTPDRARRERTDTASDRRRIDDRPRRKTLIATPRTAGRAGRRSPSSAWRSAPACRNHGNLHPEEAETVALEMGRSSIAFRPHDRCGAHGVARADRRVDSLSAAAWSTRATCWRRRLAHRRPRRSSSASRAARRQRSLRPPAPRRPAAARQHAAWRASADDRAHPRAPRPGPRRRDPARSGKRSAVSDVTASHAGKVVATR